MLTATILLQHEIYTNIYVINHILLYICNELKMRSLCYRHSHSLLLKVYKSKEVKLVCEYLFVNQNRRTIQNYRYIESANNILKLQFRLVLSRQYVFYNLNLEITKAINGCQHRIFGELIWVKQKSSATLESWLYLYSTNVWSL